MQEQNWDSLFVRSEDGRPRYINGKEIPNWQDGPTLPEAVKHLIWKGWKPVATPLTVAGVGNPMLRLSLIFRRRKKQ